MHEIYEDERSLELLINNYFQKCSVDEKVPVLEEMLVSLNTTKQKWNEILTLAKKDMEKGTFNKWFRVQDIQRLAQDRITAETIRAGLENRCNAVITKKVMETNAGYGNDTAASKGNQSIDINIKLIK